MNKRYSFQQASKTSTSQRKPLGVVKLSQDVHAHSIVFCVQQEGQKPKAPRKMDPGRYRAQVEEIVASAEKVYSCYEAGPTGFALHRQLTALGVENIVVAPNRLDEQGKRVNNDNTDTITLACRLDRYVAGNHKVFTVVRVPTKEEEQRRAIPRQRKQLQQQRLSLASQGRSLVLTQGVAISNNWWKPQEWEFHQKALAPWLVQHLEIFREVILTINEQIKKLAERFKQLRAAAKTQAVPKYAGESLDTIEAEVMDWNRFSSWRKAGSYTGLTGGVSASGRQHSDLSITKVGNPRIRRLLIQMAWRLSRHQPDYWLTKKWAKVLDPRAKAHRRQRKRAIVAYARQLFVDLWKWKTGRITAEKLGWTMTTIQENDQTAAE